MPRLTALEKLLQGIPCRKPGQLRHPVTGKCRKSTSAFNGSRYSSAPDKYVFSNGHWRLISPRQTVASANGCGPFQRYSAARGCYSVAKHQGPRKPRTNCKYGFNSALGRCNTAQKSVASKASDPRYKAVKVTDKNGVRRTVYKLSAGAKAVAKASTGKRKVGRPRTRAPVVRRCPPGQWFSYKKQTCAPRKPRSATTHKRCAKGSHYSKLLQQCLPFSRMKL